VLRAERLDRDQSVRDLAKRVERDLLILIENLLGLGSLDCDPSLALPGIEDRPEQVGAQVEDTFAETISPRLVLLAPVALVSDSEGKRAASAMPIAAV